MEVTMAIVVILLVAAIFLFCIFNVILHIGEILGIKKD